MNIFQKRHKILGNHIGERFMPAQLRAEFLRTFPEVNPSSINPADCFWTPGKAAGCTCRECTNRGGFAVNKNGIVDMGASGWGGISSVYTATGTHRTGGFALGAASSPACAAGAGRALQIDPREATRHVQEYNAASYRGCGNIFLDAEAYRRFTEGLSREFAELVDQIAFVGERYGGAQGRFVDIREEAKLIVSRLIPVLDEWLAVVAAAKPLTQEIPDKATLDFLFFPFEGTKQWPVWASKTLHFLRPDVFPILDSKAKKPLGLTSLANSGRRLLRVLLGVPRCNVGELRESCGSPCR